MDKMPEKTIRMPRVLAEKWLTALRSGKYKQAKEVLFDKQTGGYCCLGVLQHCISGYTKPNEGGELPHPHWLEEWRISFCSGRTSLEGDTPATHLLWGRLNPLLTETTNATFLNDSGMSFSELADLIEARIEYTDEEE